ncbi:MAG: bifunctional folylpolyglutamate synthase/dihydrofolate synthase [Desulfobacterales bacterium]|jgi:dihydrofolate synthase / folylpolyglutamate synthase|nr:bifunctional folylpolyglutamate synthase/dihydrofolate synthase [Desulfobacteraceae bacterium]MBT7086104.1 bifunctional folylpolyglutamate synthase/dihydrofolate synthase [Desulfobacterales bacterium]MBT7697851.1 bifunctional folylpolyglutamate synthase/dihydrofolate synthase [Desulfobacterales bacterium]
MYGLRRFGIKLGLDTIANILDVLGNPQKNFPCIHIAGTNGKGSIASSLSTILNLSGYKVGMYTSPHLVKFNERICINNIPVLDEEVVESFAAVKNLHSEDREPTFFEYTTAMALYVFAKHKVDWAIIETGMGGRLDATNIIEPEVCVISNISKEHQAYLGNTIHEIAGEKGGIIKENIPIVTGVKQKSAISKLEEIAKEKSAPIYRLSKDFSVRRNRKNGFSFFGIENNWKQMQTGLLGSYQVDNAALTLATCEILIKKGANLPLETIKSGLLTNKWPGRLDIVSKDPLVMLDGAHNLAAVKNLAGFLSENMSDSKITLVTGMLDDKPFKDILEALLPVCSKLILTRPKIDRSIPPEELLPIAEKIVKDITIIPDVGDAVNYAIANTKKTEAVCIAGSLYVVGEAKEIMETGTIKFSYMQI